MFGRCWAVVVWAIGRYRGRFLQLQCAVVGREDTQWVYVSCLNEAMRLAVMRFEVMREGGEE
eukprot:scaffold34186_cov107-Amphora_coffeaeformis.AAC.1